VERYQPSPCPDLSRKEIGSRDRSPMRSQKRLPPRRAIRRRMQTLFFQDARDRRSSNLMPEILESTLNARVDNMQRVAMRRRGRRSWVVTAKLLSRTCILKGATHDRHDPASGVYCTQERSIVDGDRTGTTAMRIHRRTLAADEWDRLAEMVTGAKKR